MAQSTEVDEQILRSVMKRFASGVAVVTTLDGEHPWGTTVNSFSSVSLRPPLVLVAFDRERHIVPALNRSGRYMVNILGEESQSLSDCFAGGPPPTPGTARRSRGELCGVAWHKSLGGLPVLDDAIAALECTIVDVHPAGDHDLFIARVDSAWAEQGEQMPLLYYSGRYLRIERASVHELEGKPER
jgi:3-hydroxy-9,10-secoandrosta-1,3,5(10)-triene-9,17-dione monooxygenase reductase component